MVSKIEDKVLRRRRCYVANVEAAENENFESLLRRFNKKVQQEGILAEVRRREHYEKPSVKRKRKGAAKRRKSARISRR
jgi:small subunit ribosomal protein S21